MPSTYEYKLKQLQHGTRRLEWLSLLTGLLLLGASMVAWQLGEQKAIRKGEYNRLTTQSGIIYNDLRRQLMSIRASHFNLQAELLSDANGLESVRPFIDRRLRAFVQTITGVRSILLLDAEGRILASSDPQRQEGSLAGGELVQRVMREQQAGILYLSQPYPLAPQLLTIAVASALTDQHGQFSGMILTELSPLEIGMLLESVFYAPDMQANITHGNGVVFLAAPEQNRVLGRNLSEPGSLFTQHMQSRRNINARYGRMVISDERRIMVQQTIQPAELNISDPLIVAISRDCDAIFAKLNSERRLMIVLYLLLVGISLGAMYLWQRKRKQVFRELQHAQKLTIESNAKLVRLNRQLEQQTENMRSLAFLDELTGIANRRHFNRSLEAEWRRCQREQQPLSVLMIDADYFKQFNDLYGHQCGDEGLVQIARGLRNSLTRSHDLPARIGGEEFACLLPNTPLQGALAKAEKIRAEIEALAIPHEGSGVKPVVTVSIGVASAMPEPGVGYLSLLEVADAALYRAKKLGRNQVCCQAETE